MKVDALMRLGPRFFLLQTGTSLAMVSGHIFRLAMAWWCLQVTHSAVAFSSLIAISVAAEIYLKPFLASFGDHFNRIKFIIACQFAVLGIIVLFCLASYLDYFNLAVITSGLVVLSAISSVREPTIMGLIPDLVAEGDVTQAISRRSTINSIIMLVGPVIAASLISFFSAGLALYFSALIYILSCIAFLVLLSRFNIDENITDVKESWFHKTKGGFKAIYHVKSEFHIALVSTVINFTMFPFFSVTIPYWINSELKLPATYLGAFEFSFAMGLIVSSLYINNVVMEWAGRLNNVLFGFVLLGSSVMTIVLVGNIYISIALAFFCGTAFIFINVNLSTLRATATPRDYRTRMSAMAAFLSSLANPFGVGIAGWYISMLGVVPFTVISGAVVVLIAPFILCSFHLRRALSLTEAEMKGYYEKTYPQAFYKRGEHNYEV
ncbi:H+ Antiporter protein [Citrobacter freundii]|uniref:MFS transporter n=1 Tax=Citrobacter braakii TaxID=57706 RepID=UPI000DF10D41|nr:MFS transporter [Citrobacter braakii]MBJ9237516.1 MFS transporter [Citrobacter braakii]STA75478.1 H+ Antiporter protein [Citrobacter freundii]SUX72254.1 H+ Antiporter protein [Citrobacter freundii]